MAASPQYVIIARIFSRKAAGTEGRRQGYEEPNYEREFM
jgi:hypothetical protein